MITHLAEQMKFDTLQDIINTEDNVNDKEQINKLTEQDKFYSSQFLLIYKDGELVEGKPGQRKEDLFRQQNIDLSDRNAVVIHALNRNIAVISYCNSSLISSIVDKLRTWGFKKIYAYTDASDSVIQRYASKIKKGIQH